MISMASASNSPFAPSFERVSTPGAYGGVHTASGCWTCRLCCEECDEQPNNQAVCSACASLQIEHTGAAAKCADSLKKSRNIVQLSDTKGVVASRQMAEVHSASSARGPEGCSTLYHTSSSSTPPRPPLRSLPNNDYPSRRGHCKLNYNHYPHLRESSTTPEHRPASPQSTEGYSPHITSSPSTVQPFPHRIQRRYQPYSHAQYQMQLVNQTPATQSTFGPSYNLPEQFFASLFSSEGQNDPLSCDFGVGVDEFVSSANAAGAYSIPQSVDARHQPNDLYPLLFCYKTEVVTVQYLLSTTYMRDLIVNTIAVGQQIVSDPTSEQLAAALLSQVYYLRFARPRTQPVLQVPDVRLKLFDIERGLNKDIISCEDAMAALHLISVILFDGGSGQWPHYLAIASGYVRARMRGLYRNADGLEELRKLSEKEAFIVKTSIWFEVLASVTIKRKPLLMDIIQRLFKPQQSSVEDLGVASAPDPGEERSSMMSPMGCENKVVWALAEINALATWKQEQKERGRLSVRDLVQRSIEIERELETQHHHTTGVLSDFSDDPVAYSRYIASNIFRASAMLYLHSVVSGGYPHVVQIKSSVEEVMRWIRRIPKKPATAVDKKIHKSVIRSTVFGFYITGALTDDVKHRKLIHEYLLDEAEEQVGNVYNIASILEGIWKERGVGGDASKSKVAWREMLVHNREPVLLV